MATPVSQISKALLGKTDTPNIHEPTPSGSIFANEAAADHAAAAATVLPTENAPGTYNPLTPPHSVSPMMPTPVFHNKSASEAAAVSSPPYNFESDIDMPDAVDEASNHETAQQELRSMSHHEESGYEGFITPAFLAREKLPEIVLEKGPVAIRHIINDLARTLPGFSKISPAKARRLVVAGLEFPAGGGYFGNIEFLKVGWGRWSAKVKDHQLERVVSETSPSSKTPTVDIPGARASNRKRPRRHSHGSWAEDSSGSSRFGSQNERIATGMAENEADKMSIDGENDREPQFRNAGSRSSYYNKATLQETAFSDTDEEDWSSMGALALSQGSYLSKNPGKYLGEYSGPYLSTSFSRNTSSRSRTRSNRRPKSTQTEGSFDPAGINPEEREAAETLEVYRD